MRLLLTIAVLLFALLPAHAAEPVPRTKKVLLIGIDGLRPDALEAAETPFLDALKKDGSWTDDTQILGERYQKNDTISGPGWSSILTGVWADKHGVHDNKFEGTNYDEYPPFFERLKTAWPKARTAMFLTWPPLARHLAGGADVVEQIHIEGDKAPHFARSEVEVADAAAYFLTNDNPDAVFVYFGMVDSMGHTKGFHPKVPEYIQAIEHVDTCLGKVLTALVKRKKFATEDWLVLVTTDHGGKGLNHDKGHRVPEILNVFTIVSGPSAARGKLEGKTYLVDVPVTALAHLGVELDEKLAEQFDGRPIGLKTADESQPATE